MNPGHAIFKRVQHLAEGSSGLNYDPADPRNNLTTGSGSGAPTNRGIGIGANVAGNFLFPGLGMLTGPIAQWAWRMYQNGASLNQVQKVVQGYQASGGQSGDNVTAPAADDGSNATAPVSNAPPSAGIGIDPFGNPADPGEFWSNDFGRWGEGDSHGTTPGNYNPSGPGGGYGTRGVWGGQTTIPISSDPNFTPSLGWAMPAASGGGAYGGNTMAKIALHSGTFRDAATPEQWAFMQNYLSGGGGGGGGGQGVGGAGRPMTQAQQMGTSDINPGLKLFHQIQKRKKKP
jgi:hypothetical protein